MNKKNLRKLADHLETVDDSIFNMACYSETQCDEYTSQIAAIEDNHCETSACAIGHATTIIPLTFQDLKTIKYVDGEHDYMIDFHKYTKRVFDIEPGRIEWEWCFSEGWSESGESSYPGTKATEAAARIRLLISDRFTKKEMCDLLKTSTLVEI